MSPRIRRSLLSLLSPQGPRARLLVLTFHQVPAEPDPLAPEVPHAEVFERQMRWLSTYCDVLALPDATSMLAGGRLPARAACVTFDDGYADNLLVAAPILEQFSMPATFFITGGAVEDGIMWNDLVIEGVRRADRELDLEELQLGRHELDGNDARRRTVALLIDKLKYQPAGARLELARRIFGAAAASEPPRLMLTKQQVADLGRRGFDIGAHTINHPILATLESHAARSEISGSGEWVAEVTGVKPKSFAYPNGRPGRDFRPEHEEMVREEGFSLAVTTEWGAATSKSSPFAVPRFAPWERNETGYWQRLARTLVRSYV